MSLIIKTPALVELAQWIVPLTLDEIPQRVQEKVRYQIINVLASQYASQHHAGAQALKACVYGWGKTGKCTVIPTGEKMPLHEAVLVNCVNSMALDYDDYLYMGHTGHSAIVASWALCEEFDLPASDLLLLAVIGNEIGGRLGITTALGPQNGQAWSYIHSIAAAAITAKAQNLTVEQTTHAMAIALYQPGFTLWPGFMGADSKLLTAANPTVQGIQAAQFAKAGMTGSTDVLDHPTKGFWKYFTYVSVPHMMGGLGKSWLSDTLTFKKYPGCAYIDTSMDALFELLENFETKHGKALNHEDIAAINITANFLTVEMDNLSHEYRDESCIQQTMVNFSIPLNIAIALQTGRLGGAELNQNNLNKNRETLNKIANKVTLTHDWDMTLYVIDSVNRCMGEQSLTASLGVKQWRQLINGFRSQLGGKRKHGLNRRQLWSQRRKLLQIIKDRPKLRGQSPDLGKVDFSQFEMSFPAKVELQLLNGETLSCRKDVPFGAQAQTNYLDTVSNKFLQESEAGKVHREILDQLEDADTFFKIDINTLSDQICSKPSQTKYKKETESVIEH